MMAEGTDKKLRIAKRGRTAISGGRRRATPMINRSIYKRTLAFHSFPLLVLRLDLLKANGLTAHTD